MGQSSPERRSPDGCKCSLALIILLHTLALQCTAAMTRNLMFEHPRRGALQLTRSGLGAALQNYPAQPRSRCSLFKCCTHRQCEAAPFGTG